MIRILLAAALAAIPLPASAGTLHDAVSGLGSGTVVFEFAAAPDVYGNGRSITTGDHAIRSRDWCRGCTNGPVRVTRSAQYRNRSAVTFCPALRLRLHPSNRSASIFHAPGHRRPRRAVASPWAR